MRTEPATVFIDHFFSAEQAFTLYMAPESGRVDLISKNKCIYFLTIEKGYEVLYDGETNNAIGEVRHVKNGVKFTSKKEDVLSFTVSSREISGQCAMNKPSLNFLVYYTKSRNGETE